MSDGNTLYVDGNYPVGLPREPPAAHFAKPESFDLSPRKLRRSYWTKSHQIYKQCRKIIAN